MQPISPIWPLISPSSVSFAHENISVGFFIRFTHESTCCDRQLERTEMMIVVAAVNEDDIEQFVARMIVQPPPPLNTPDTDDVNTPVRCDTDDVIVTSTGNSHVTSNVDVNSGNPDVTDVLSYPRAGSIDKTADIYVNLAPARRASDLPCAPARRPQQLHCDNHPCHYVNAQLPPDDTYCQYNRRSLRWYDASYDCQQTTTDVSGHSGVAVQPATSLRPVSLQHELVQHSYTGWRKKWINDSSGVFARWRHSAMKFLNKKLMTVFSIL